MSDVSEFEEESNFESESESIESNLLYENEDDEKLHKLLVDKFKELKIKNCINFKDPDNNDKMKNFIERGRINDELEENIDGYKVLLKGISYMRLYGEITAFYIPKHINFIDIMGKYRIIIKKENQDLSELIESSKSDLENLLEKSKDESGEKTFKDTYKKVVLVEPYVSNRIPFYISFDNMEQFYYETIIRDVIHIDDKYNSDGKIQIDDSYQDKFIDEISEYGYPTFWYNYINEYVQYVTYKNPHGHSYNGLVPRTEKVNKFNTFMPPKIYKENKSENDGVWTVSDAIYSILHDYVYEHNIMITSMYMKNNEDFDKQKIHSYDLNRFIQTSKTEVLVTEYNKPTLFER